MKHVVAFIKPHKLDDVILALHKIEGLTGASISDVRGIGRNGGTEDSGQGQTLSWELKPYVKLEVFCSDDLTEQIVSTIRSSAHTGLPSDGKIYVSHVGQAIRIRNGELGEGAV